MPGNMTNWRRQQGKHETYQDKQARESDRARVLRRRLGLRRDFLADMNHGEVPEWIPPTDTTPREFTPLPGTGRRPNFLFQALTLVAAAQAVIRPLPVASSVTKEKMVLPSSTPTAEPKLASTSSTAVILARTSTGMGLVDTAPSSSAEPIILSSTGAQERNTTTCPPEVKSLLEDPIRLEKGLQERWRSVSSTTNAEEFTTLLNDLQSLNQACLVSSQPLRQLTISPHNMGNVLSLPDQSRAPSDQMVFSAELTSISDDPEELRIGHQGQILGGLIYFSAHNEMRAAPILEALIAKYYRSQTLVGDNIPHQDIVIALTPKGSVRIQVPELVSQIVAIVQKTVAKYDASPTARLPITITCSPESLSEETQAAVVAKIKELDPRINFSFRGPESSKLTRDDLSSQGCDAIAARALVGEETYSGEGTGQTPITKEQASIGASCGGNTWNLDFFGPLNPKALMIRAGYARFGADHLYNFSVPFANNSRMIADYYDRLAEKFGAMPTKEKFSYVFMFTSLVNGLNYIYQNSGDAALIDKVKPFIPATNWADIGHIFGGNLLLSYAVAAASMLPRFIYNNYPTVVNTDPKTTEFGLVYEKQHLENRKWVSIASGLQAIAIFVQYLNHMQQSWLYTPQQGMMIAAFVITSIFDIALSSLKENNSLTEHNLLKRDKKPTLDFPDPLAHIIRACRNIGLAPIKHYFSSEAQFFITNSVFALFGLGNPLHSTGANFARAAAGVAANGVAAGAAYLTGKGLMRLCCRSMLFGEENEPTRVSINSNGSKRQAKREVNSQTPLMEGITGSRSF